jgi:hypothetical protein
LAKYSLKRPICPIAFGRTPRSTATFEFFAASLTFINFLFFLPLFAFSSLYLPLLIKVPKGRFGGIFGRPARAARAGWPGRKLTVSTSLMLEE